MDMIDSQPALIAEARRRLAGAVSFELELMASGLEEYRRGGVHAVRPRGGKRVPGPVRSAARAPGDPPPLPSFRAFPFFHHLRRAHGAGAADRSRSQPAGHRALSPDDGRKGGRGEPSGDSRCGRHLLTLLPRCGYRILEAGPSDWIVYPRDGEYPADERFFLSCILDFFEESLSSRPELGKGELDRWMKTRRGQLDAGELVFMAHQLDVLASAAEGGA